MFKRKQKKSYLIRICQNGKLETIYCQNKKEKDKWLFNYFTTEEKWWIWNKYEQLEDLELSFEKFVKLFIKKDNVYSSVQSIPIRKGKIIVIQEKKLKGR